MNIPMILTNVYDDLTLHDLQSETWGFYCCNVVTLWSCLLINTYRIAIVHSARGDVLNAHNDVFMFG